MSKPQVISDPDEIFHLIRRQQMAGAQSRRHRVGLVPTMGALHEGHLSLVRQAKQECDATVVTIFVNPTQFGEGEDFGQYPRTLDTDVAKLAGEAVDYVFAPAADAIYRPGHSTYVEPPAAALPLEGQFRPGHFRGVATIVLKLFHRIPADIAFFGQKDYQQALVIRRMTDDLNVPIEICVCPTVREADGLAMSSRNAYLSGDERTQALAIVQSLRKAKQLREAGETLASSIQPAMRTILHKAGIDRIDYVALADPESLQDRVRVEQPTIALIAAHVGNTRLIDNLML